MSRQFAECAVTAQRKAAMSHQEKAGDNPLISGRLYPIWVQSMGHFNGLSERRVSRDAERSASINACLRRRFGRVLPEGVRRTQNPK